jgi:transcriptional regulator with XRE-family HTH domain
MDYRKVVEMIKDRKNQLRINQNDLAEISGVGLRTIKEIESGKGNPTLATLNRIFEVLGLEIVLQVKKNN